MNWLMTALCPSDVTHVMNASPFLPLFHFHVLLSTQTEDQNQDRLGNVANRQVHVCEIRMCIAEKQVWYFLSKNQLGLRCSNPFKSPPGSHSLLASDSVGTTSSCSLLAFPLSVSLTLLRLCCLCFSVSISNHMEKLEDIWSSSHPQRC